MTPEMYHRDMDRDMGRMYYTETSSSGMRDAREGRSGMSRRTYMENKELHKANTQQDKEAKVDKWNRLEFKACRKSQPYADAF